MFEMMSLSNDETEKNFFFAQTLENFIVLIYLLFDEDQTSLYPCLCIRVFDCEQLKQSSLTVSVLLIDR